MELKIASPHWVPADELVELVRKKFEHLATMYERIHRCEVVLRKVSSGQQKDCCVEARMDFPGSVVFATETEESFELALGKLMDDLEHQLRKRKEACEENR